MKMYDYIAYLLIIGLGSTVATAFLDMPTILWGILKVVGFVVNLTVLVLMIKAVREQTKREKGESRDEG